MPTPRPAAEGEADIFEQRPEPTCSVGVALRQYGCLLNKGLARAFSLVATKSTDPQIDDRPSTGNWQIAQIPLVATVERFRPPAAIRAVRAFRFTPNGQVNDLVAQLYLLENERSAWRQQ